MNEKVNKERIVKELENLIKLIKEDKVLDVNSSSLRYYFPELGSIAVQTGEADPKCVRQDITFYIAYKR